MSNIVYEFLTVFLISFFCVFALTPLVIKLAHKINFVDNPNARKMHLKAMPLMGGISVFIGFIFVTVLELVLSVNRSFDKGVIGYLLGALIIVVIGLIDDKFELSPKVKMMGQILSCFVFIYFNGLMQEFGPVYISLPIIMLWMVGLMNALNFLDNMDGIISGMAVVLALGFYSVSLLTKTESIAPFNNYVGLLAITFAGSVLGFLPYNFNPARIFLGDAGSMFFGYFLSTMGILIGKLSSNMMQNNFYYLIPIIMLSYAIFDISFVSITRKMDGRRISQGGKDHTTHRLRTLIGSVKLTAIMVALINILLVILTILVFKTNSLIVLVIVTIMVLISFIILGMRLEKVPITVTPNQMKGAEDK